jgi:ribosomal protein S18 acetylase RimI-like enzyme
MDPIGHGSPVVVIDAPEIPGLLIRTYGGDADLPGMVDVYNTARLADAFDLVITVEGLKVELEHAPNADPVRDVLLAEVDGRIVAVSTRQWAVRDGIRCYEHDGSVLPDFRGRGIGRAMLRTNEAALRAYADADPEGRPGVFSVWSPDSAEPTVRLLLEEGYRPVRYFFEMTRRTLDDLPAPEMPPGLTIRPVDIADLRRIVRAEDEAFRDHWGHRELGDSDIDGLLANPDLDPSLMVVAWDGDDIAGVVTNTIYAAENAALGIRRGWLERVSVRRPWRRRGVASAMIVESLRRLRERDMTSASLGVDAENPSGALGLYERFGFATNQRAATYRKSIDADGSS